MNLPKYEITSNKNSNFYKFISTGPKGSIVKGIQFSLIEYSEFPVFNLALGDLDNETGKLNDSVRSDNKDRDKIFATIGAAVLDFCNRYKGVAIFAEGNTPAKQMVYRIQIASHLAAVNEYFTIYGFIDDHWEVFQKNRRYTSLLVKPV